MGTRTLAILCALLLIPVRAGAQDPTSTHLRMQKVVRDFVARSSQEVIGLGSWISGRNYTATSDHDMRLVVRGGDRAGALSQWEAARTELRDLVRREFGDQADRVLRSVNLYPPSQLMSGVENAADAVERFRGLGQVPSLSVTGIPTDAARYSEGLYGGGARVWTQGYERSAGRLFYREGERVFVGMTDLTHMSEGLGTFDLPGMTNTSRQWMDHIDDAVRAGNGQQVAKYLDRLNRDLAKAKDLGRLTQNQALRSEIQSISWALKDNPGALGRLQGRLESALARGRQETAILERYARSGPTARLMLAEALEDLAGEGRMRRILNEAGGMLSLDQALRAVTLYVELRRSLNYAAEEEFDRAYQTALAGALGMVSLPAGLAAELGAWALESAQAKGIALVASTQDAWDLMSGVYTAVGREDLDTGRGYALQDLVAHIDDQGRLENLVRAKAALAAHRGFGGVAATTDEKVADAIFARTWPVIRDAWILQRETLTAEFEALAMAVEQMPVLLRYTPYPATVQPGGEAVVRVAARIAHPDYERARTRLREILGLLCHTSPYLNLEWRWVGGEDGGESWMRTYRFKELGPNPVVASGEISLGATGKWANSLFTRTLVLPAGVDVMVEGAPPEDAAPDTVPAEPEPAPPVAEPPPPVEQAEARAAGPLPFGRWMRVSQVYLDREGPPGNEIRVSRTEGSVEQQRNWFGTSVLLKELDRSVPSVRGSKGEVSLNVNYSPSLPENAEAGHSWPWRFVLSVFSSYHETQPQPPRTAALQMTVSGDGVGAAGGSGPLQYDPSQGNRVEVRGTYMWPEPIAVGGRPPRLTVRVEVDGVLGRVVQITTYEWTAW